MDWGVERRGYLELLDESRKVDAIKVLMGMRRTGKSTLMKQFIQHLRDEGIQEKDIVYVDMESLSNADYSDGMKLYDRIISSYSGNRMYILLDEVQLIDGWQRVVNSLKIDIDCDIYLTGSNAYLLSTDISTLITGRSISITILPLSLPELDELGMGMGMGPKATFVTYYRYGGMPVMRPEYSPDMILHRVEAIKSDIILKDICNRKKVDASKVRKVIDYLFSEIGNQISVDTVSQSLGMSTSTVSEYLDMITDAMLFTKVERYDIKGREILKSLSKYYCTDLGMRSTQPVSVDGDLGHILENIVYLELVRRGKTVYVGKTGNTEIDFVTIDGNRVDYYQVAYTIREPKVMEREIGPLRQISGRGERYLITYDDYPMTETQDAIILNIVDFLMETPHNVQKRTVDNRKYEAYMNVYQRLDSYVKVCSKLMNTIITPKNFDGLSDQLQYSFFDMQSSFRHPMVINDAYLHDRIEELVEIEVNMFDALMACANSNRFGGTNKPVNLGAMERLTNISKGISKYIGDRYA